MGWIGTRYRHYQYGLTATKCIVLLVFLTVPISFYQQYVNHEIDNSILQLNINSAESESSHHEISVLRKKTKAETDYHLTSKRNFSHSARNAYHSKGIVLNRSEHHTANSHMPTYPKIINLKNIKQSETNIFFIESTCGTRYSLTNYSLTTGIHLNQRQCCAIESAALENKSHKIYILHTCPINKKLYIQSSEYIKQTVSQRNVFVVLPRMRDIFQGTPVEDLYNNNIIHSSLYPVEHLSDILRLVVLWKFGGTYLDLDTIAVRSLDELKPDFAGLTRGGLVSNAVLNFKHIGSGHDKLTHILEELAVSFDGSQWAVNGPHLITRMLLKECHFEKVEQLATDHCSTFTIFPPEYFFSVPYPDYDILFRELASEEVSARFGGSFIIHFWNKLSKELSVEVGSNQVYGLLADEYCPSVYHTCGRYF